MARRTFLIPSAKPAAPGELSRDARRYSSRKTLASRGLGGLSFLLVVFLPSISAAAADVSGFWYGEGYQPAWHESAQWLMRLSPDGVYAVHFRRYRDCVLTVDQKETGTWRLSDMFHTVTTAVDGVPTHHENDYRVDGITDTEFRITHLATGQDYVEKRVAPEFSFPKPDCVTS
jgi:hypothetical protein